MRGEKEHQRKLCVEFFKWMLVTFRKCTGGVEGFHFWLIIWTDSYTRQIWWIAFIGLYLCLTCSKNASPSTARRSGDLDRKSTRLNSSHDQISYAVFCLKKKKK